MAGTDLNQCRQRNIYNITSAYIKFEIFSNLGGILPSSCIRATLSAAVSLWSAAQNLKESSADLNSCLTAKAHLMQKLICKY